MSIWLTRLLLFVVEAVQQVVLNHVVVVSDQVGCVVDVVHQSLEVYLVELVVEAVELLRLAAGCCRQTWALKEAHLTQQIKVELLHLAILVAKDHLQREHVPESWNPKLLL